MTGGATAARVFSPRLDGSCHCGAVRFSVSSHTPHPYQLCYCTICRKTAGGGGYAINLMAVAGTLEITLSQAGPGLPAGALVGPVPVW